MCSLSWKAWTSSDVRRWPSEGAGGLSCRGMCLVSVGHMRCGDGLIFISLRIITYKFEGVCVGSSVALLCLTPCNPMDCIMPGFPVYHQLPELIQTHVHRVGDAIQPSYPLPSPSPAAFNLSQHQGLFQWVSSSSQVAKVMELQFQHENFYEYSGFISFRMDWLDLLAVQGTLKSLFQHHSSNASILWRSAFFIV